MFFFDQDDRKFRPRSIESAYFCILNDDLKTASAIFESLDSPRARWGMILVSTLEGFIQIYPTYFDIRNFLEIDLDFLIKNEKVDYVQMVLGALELFSSINHETYKYVARVMYENKYYKSAREYMEKSKQIFYNDPELHFMYAKFFYEFGNYSEAEFYIDECISILPDYYPAKVMKKKIVAEVNKGIR